MGHAMGQYIDEADIDAVFGSRNVDLWADVDNDADATEIANRKAKAIAVAESRVDNMFRSMYVVPLAPTSALDGDIKDLIAKLAGIWLHDARGRTRETPTAGIYADMEQEVNELLAEYACGNRQTGLIRNDGFQTNRGMVAVT